MNLWPPGPCPPTALLRGEGCDLGVRLLEVCYTQSHIQSVVRPALERRIAEALERGDGPAAAAALQGMLDSWPVAALIDASVKLWTDRAAAAVVPVLAKAAELLCLAHGWSKVGSGPWPMPDEEWITAQIPPGVRSICRRSDTDGSDLLEGITGHAVVERPWALPAVDVVSAEMLVPNRGEIVGRLVRAEVACIELVGELPPGPDARLAMGEVRMEALAQAAYERFGVAGLIAPRAPMWRQLLRPAPAGTEGDVLHQACDTAVIPGPPSALIQGTASPVGWLLWRGPHGAVAVQPEAVAVLGQLDGERTIQQIADSMDAPAGVVKQMADQLVKLGAATA